MGYLKVQVGIGGRAVYVDCSFYDVGVQSGRCHCIRRTTAASRKAPWHLGQRESVTAKWRTFQTGDRERTVEGARRGRACAAEGARGRRSPEVALTCRTCERDERDKS